MKLPSFKRLFDSDFPQEFKSLITTLSASLNNGIDVLYQALNNQITLRDNISCTVRDVSVIVNASGTPLQGSSMKLNTTNKVDGVIVISALNQSNPSAFPPAAVMVNFTQSSNILNISNISGLTPGQSYLLRIVAFQA